MSSVAVASLPEHAPTGPLLRLSATAGALATGLRRRERGARARHGALGSRLRGPALPRRERRHGPARVPVAARQHDRGARPPARGRGARRRRGLERECRLGDRRCTWRARASRSARRSSRSPRTRRGAPAPLASWRDYLTLTKPRIMTLLLLTGAAGMFVGAQGVPPLDLFLVTMVGLASRVRRGLGAQPRHRPGHRPAHGQPYAEPAGRLRARDAPRRRSSSGSSCRRSRSRSSPRR